MDVSFIVPALNEEKCIEKTLKSLKAQKTKLKYETIVVDGKSKDRTVAIAKKYARIVSQKTLGIANARNIGAKHAKGKLLIFVDADTTIPTDFLDICWDYMQSHKDMVALTARIKYDTRNLAAKILWKIVESFIRLGSFFGRGQLVGINTVTWKDVFDEIGGFPEIVAEDTAITSLFWKIGRTKYFTGTYSLSSARRFEKNPWEIIPYYISLYIVMRFRQARSPKIKKLGAKIEKKLGKRAEYKPIR